MGKDLDKVEQSVSKWGKVGISEFALLPNKSQFALNYSMNATDYVTAARQGVSASSSSSEVDTFKAALGLAAGLQPPGGSAGSPSKQPASAPASSAGSNGGSAGQAQAGGPSNQAKSTTASSSGGSTGGSGTQTQASGKSASAPASEKLAVSERVAMTTGLNDKLAELVLNQLANPSADDNSEIFFGVFQVTCQPGSETWKDYIAEVNVALEYARPDLVSGEPDLSRKWESNAGFTSPMVLAVLPLMDSQRMDLSASRDSQTELALTLAAAYAAQPGMQAQANMLMEYVRQRDTDMKSRTAVPTITTYADGSNFEFQIYPAFQAKDNAASTRASGANVLQPVCFPAVVVLRVNKSSFDLQNPWRSLVAHVHTRWIPTRTRWISEHPYLTCALTILTLDYYQPDLPPSASDRIEIEKCLDDATERMAILTPRYSNTGPYRDLERAIPPLISAARGVTRLCTLPVSQEFLKESDSQQSNQDTSKTAKLTIQGELFAADTDAALGGQKDAASAGQREGASETLFGFVNAPTVISVESNKPQFQSKGNQSAVKMVTLDGCPCAFTVLGKNTLTFTVPAGSFDDRVLGDPTKLTPKFTPHRLTITTTTGSQSTSLPTTGSQQSSLSKNVNIKFVKTIAEPVSYPSEFGYKPTVTITRDSLGKVTGITVDGNNAIGVEASKELLHAIEKILLKSEATHAPELPIIIKNETLPAPGGGGVTPPPGDGGKTAATGSAPAGTSGKK